MGKGDQRTRRGKIYRGTFGKRRPRRKPKVNKPVAEELHPPAETPPASEVKPPRLPRRKPKEKKDETG